MEDLRKTRQTKKNNSFFKKKILIFIKNNKIKIFISILSFFIILFPELSGQLIGQFITDFIGNIIKYIKL